MKTNLLMIDCREPPCRSSDSCPLCPAEQKAVYPGPVN